MASEEGGMQPPPAPPPFRMTRIFTNSSRAHANHRHQQEIVGKGKEKKPRHQLKNVPSGAIRDKDSVNHSSDNVSVSSSGAGSSTAAVVVTNACATNIVNAKTSNNHDSQRPEEVNIKKSKKPKKIKSKQQLPPQPTPPPAEPAVLQDCPPGSSAAVSQVPKSPSKIKSQDTTNKVDEGEENRKKKKRNRSKKSSKNKVESSATQVDSEAGEQDQGKKDMHPSLIYFNPARGPSNSNLYPPLPGPPPRESVPVAVAGPGPSSQSQQPAFNFRGGFSSGLAKSTTLPESQPRQPPSATAVSSEASRRGPSTTDQGAQATSQLSSAYQIQQNRNFPPLPQPGPSQVHSSSTTAGGGPSTSRSNSSNKNEFKQRLKDTRRMQVTPHLPKGKGQRREVPHQNAFHPIPHNVGQHQHPHLPPGQHFGVIHVPRTPQNFVRVAIPMKIPGQPFIRGQSHHNSHPQIPHPPQPLRHPTIVRNTYPPRHVQQHQAGPSCTNMCIPSEIFVSQIPSELPLVFPGTGQNPYNCNDFPELSYFMNMVQHFSGDGPRLKPKALDMITYEFRQLSLSQQLEDFFRCQVLPLNEVRLQWQLLLDMLIILRENGYPHCEVYAFGSTVTGLADFSSDIDIYVDLLGESSSAKINPRESVREVKKIFKKCRCPHTGAPFARQLISIAGTRVRVPILKLGHAPSQMECDLSFGNRLSVQNSRLLAFYINCDARIKHCMVLIRYWAKFHELTGSNKIKNYALTLLVLVYLCKKKLVPSISLLQKLQKQERGSSKNLDEIDGWDASFCDNPAVIQRHFKATAFPGSTETLTLIQMTKEFFEMYANLDLTKVVVCPLLGDVLPRQDFQNPCLSLPPELDRYTDWVHVKQRRRLDTYVPFCVQDPFDLAFNIGCVTSDRTIFQFQLACAKTAEVLRTAGDLKSLLDVLVPVPELFLGGGRKRRRVPKVNTWREILGVFKLREPPLPVTKQPPTPPSNLPPHLKRIAEEEIARNEKLSRDKEKEKKLIMTELKQWQRFESLFAGELVRYKIQLDKIVSLEIVTMLWGQMAQALVDDFFVTGFKLEVVQSSSKFKKAEVKSGAKSGGTWKLKISSHVPENGELIPPEKSEEGINLFTEKMKELPPKSFALGNSYRVMTLLVTYPFWEKRNAVMTTVGKEMKQAGEVKNGKSNSGGMSYYDPIEVESRTSAAIQKEFLEQQSTTDNFAPFQIRLCIKLCIHSVKQRPEMLVIFEEENLETGSSNPNYWRAVDNLSTALSRAQPMYHLVELSRWFQSNTYDCSFDPADEVACPSTQPGTSSRGTTGQEKEIKNTDKQKTKKEREEELLIPSSSSSSSVSNLTDGVEGLKLAKDEPDKSGDDDDDDDCLSDFV